MIACEKCKGEIPPADFNIATDIAFCRACNVQFKYSDISATVTPTGFDPSNWPKGLTYSQSGTDERLVYKQLSSVLFFLIPFCAFWSGGSMYVIYIRPLMEGRLDVGNMLFGIPFLLGTIVIVGVILLLLFGQFDLHINPREARLGWTWFGFGKMKTFDPGSMTAVLLKDSTVSRNDVPQKEIVVKLKNGDAVPFGALLSPDAKDKIAAFLANKLRHRPDFF